MADATREAALVAELGAQLSRLRGAGPKIRQFLSLVGLDPPPAPLGALPESAAAVPFRNVRKVVEQDLEGRLGDLFDDFDEEPFALASLGQVHRARTLDGDDVAVKVQHAGAADAIASDLRNIGLLAPLISRLAPGPDAGALLDEVRDRISDELDHEVEAQHQRRLERRFRGHPDVRIPRVHTELSARRVLVTEHVEGLGGAAIAQLPEAERDRAGEIAFRFYIGLAWRDGIVAGDPHADNLILCPDGRVCLLDFGLVRDIDAAAMAGERAVVRALTAADAAAVHEQVGRLGYLEDPDSVDPDALLALLAAAGDWLVAGGERRIDPVLARALFEHGYPPRSPHFALMRRLRIPPSTLLLRRMEVQLLGLVGDLRAAADWGAISAESHSDAPPAGALGRADAEFRARRRS